jgi:uncharacterized protein (TIGR03118 family)
MKTINVTISKVIQAATLVTVIMFLMNITSCKKDTSDLSYQKVNLVADTLGYNALRIDANLLNAWGIAIGPNGEFYISSNHGPSAVVYDRNGGQISGPIAVNENGAPSGAVHNNTSSFNGSVILFVGEDGIINAWTSNNNTSIVVDRSSSNTVYKGVTIAQDGGANFLYACDFHNSKVDVFDGNFNLVTNKPFADATIPADFAPFNIRYIDGKLYVTYAKHKAPDNMDDQKGAGNGYINVFNTDGSFVKRFASQGSLNSPWAIVKAPDGFGLGDNIILVGNFGDGAINFFNTDGDHKGQLKDAGNAILIDGLWGLAFPENGLPSGDQNTLFFTAGPVAESHGLFGTLTKR